MPDQEDVLRGIDTPRYDFKDPEKFVFRSRKGLDKEIVEQISAYKGEPQWMLENRLKALEHFNAMSMPSWGVDLQDLDLNDLLLLCKTY